ncbi:H(+)-exporting diphosphatase [Forsythia ovata]|uniref:H(+)-exporting diphosphatase n=1 Tax=Forsythia ovata TaxID=205694 RepID=A0ABD1U6H0_9LAMI
MDFFKGFSYKGNRFRVRSPDSEVVRVQKKDMGYVYTMKIIGQEFVTRENKTAYEKVECIGGSRHIMFICFPDERPSAECPNRNGQEKHVQGQFPHLMFPPRAVHAPPVAALGMLSTNATGLAIDACGLVSDNARGIAEMAGMSHRIYERTEARDETYQCCYWKGYV